MNMNTEVYHSFSCSTVASVIGRTDVLLSLKTPTEKCVFCEFSRALTLAQTIAWRRLLVAVETMESLEETTTLDFLEWADERGYTPSVPSSGAGKHQI